MNDENLGSAMRALDERRRAFVWELLSQEVLDQGRAAEAAGFCPIETSVSKNRSGLLRKTGSVLVHEPGVQAAILEVGGKELVGLVLPSVRAMAKMVRDPKSRGHRNAVEGVLDRAGLASTQRITVDHTHTDNTGKALVERARAAAARLGMDPDEMVARLFGGAPMKVIEGVADVVHQPSDQAGEVRPSTARIGGAGQSGGERG